MKSRRRMVQHLEIIDPEEMVSLMRIHAGWPTPEARIARHQMSVEERHVAEAGFALLQAVAAHPGYSEIMERLHPTMSSVLKSFRAAVESEKALRGRQDEEGLRQYEIAAATIEATVFAGAPIVGRFGRLPLLNAAWLDELEIARDEFADTPSEDPVSQYLVELAPGVRLPNFDPLEREVECFLAAKIRHDKAEAQYREADTAARAIAYRGALLEKYGNRNGQLPRWITR